MMADIQITAQLGISIGTLAAMLKHIYQYGQDRGKLTQQVQDLAQRVSRIERMCDRRATERTQA